MSPDNGPVAPFPGVPISADLHGDTLTIYWPADPATGRIPQQQWTAAYGGWTREQVNSILGDYGVTLDALRPPRSWDAFVTVLAGAVAVGERVASATAAVSRAFSAALSAPVARPSA